MNAYQPRQDSNAGTRRLYKTAHGDRGFCALVEYDHFSDEYLVRFAGETDRVWRPAADLTQFCF